MGSSGFGDTTTTDGCLDDTAARFGSFPQQLITERTRDGCTVVCVTAICPNYDRTFDVVVTKDDS